MTATPKRIIYDESGQPTEVVVSYADWRRIEAMLWDGATSTPMPDRDIAEDVGRVVSDEEFERLSREVIGTWTAGDGLAFQEAVRAEWDERWTDISRTR